MQLLDSIENEDQTPLLNDRDNNNINNHNKKKNGHAEAQSHSERLRRKIYVFCFLIILLMEVGVYVQQASLAQVLEDIVCRSFDPKLGTNVSSRSTKTSIEWSGKEARCKSKDIQNELSMLRGMMVSFEVIPGVLTAIPYGFLADKYGRRPITILAALGVFLMLSSYSAICWWSDIFPVKMTWATPAFELIGGGGGVLTSMVFTMIADVTPEDARSTTFFYLASSVLLGEIGASAHSSILLDRGPWVPIWLGVGSVALSLLVTLFLPETLDSKTRSSIPSDLAGTDVEDGMERVQFRWLKKTRVNVSNLCTAAIRFVWSNKKMAMLLSTYMLTTLGRYVSEVLLQYVTKRYHWSWARAVLLLSLKASCSFLLLVIVLPATSYVLTRKLGYNTRLKDLYLARSSVILSAIGTLCIGLSGSPVIMTIGVAVWAIGAGYNLIIRSLLTSIVEPHHVGTLYNTMAVLETLGGLLSGPLLSVAFQQGLDLGGSWIGLPFIGASGLSITAAIVVFSVRMPTADVVFDIASSDDAIEGADIRVSV